MRTFAHVNEANFEENLVEYLRISMCRNHQNRLSVRVFMGSLHVAIRSLLEARFLLRGRTGSSSAPRFLLASAGFILGHKQEMSTVWYERAASCAVQ